MKIIETFICGKKDDPALCEDMIVITPDFYAVIDGATTKTCPQVTGKSGGRFAAEMIAAGIESLPADIGGKQAVAVLTQILRQATTAHLPDAGGGFEKPSCCFAIYSRARCQIWRVGDIGILCDGTAHMAGKSIDDITSAARAMMTQALILNGETVDSLRADDKGRAFIMPLLQQQHLFANRADAGGFGYGVMNGDDIPDVFVDVIEAFDVSEIVLASDGYPVLRRSLAQSEAALQKILTEDPLLCQLHFSTKGQQAGQVSFDDRSYLRFAPE